MQASQADQAAPKGYDRVRMSRFVRRHWAYFLLLPLLIFFGTSVHEGAHAAVVLAQGGELTDVQLLPRFEGGEVFFGAVWYEPSEPAEEWVDWTVAWAPVALWLLIAGATYLMGRSRLGPNFAGRCAVFALFHLPLFDVSMSLMGLLRALPEADLNGALAGHEVSVALVGLAVLALHMELGWRLFQRVWPTELSGLEYRLSLLFLLVLPWIRR